MKKEDEKAFLRSIVGTSPIKKNDILRKNIPVNTKKVKKNFTAITSQHKPTTLNTIKYSKTLFDVENTNINKKLKKGKIPIDLKIDLHGFSLYEAEQVFSETVQNCYNRNMRCLLFVTGKGIYKKTNSDIDSVRLYYGKIRNNFLDWTNKIELKKYILNVQQAGIEHGADGAFFVYLRKVKD